jgi:hypothetical protein
VKDLRQTGPLTADLLELRWMSWLLILQIIVLAWALTMLRALMVVDDVGTVSWKGSAGELGKELETKITAIEAK